MTTIDTDVEKILEEQVDDFQLRMLIREIIEWESDKLHKSVRHNKKTELDKKISEYLDDQ
jgi:hypothetical protein